VSLVLSFASNVRELALERIMPLRTLVRIAAFHRTAPARCGAFADERRSVGGDGGGRAHRHFALRYACSSRPFADERRVVAAMKAAECVIDERTRPRSRRSPRALRFGTMAGDKGGCAQHETLMPSIRAVRLRGCHKDRVRRIAARHTDALIATFRRAAPARCGAFVEKRRIVAGDGGERGRTLIQSPRSYVIDERARPWSRRSPRALRCGGPAGATGTPAGA